MLKFEAETARFIEDSYHGSDVVRRRLANFTALAPGPGEVIADIGCGPGLLLQEIARAVGETGRAIGLDPSAEMRAQAEARCAGRGNVEVLDGSAEALPLDDASVDKAAALQVLEYLPDIPPALAEAHRVIRPGGRLVIGDWHWDTLVWESDDPARMAEVLEAWDHHLSDRGVPARLPRMLTEAGFEVEGVSPLTYTDTTLPADGMARFMLRLIHDYVAGEGLVAADRAAAWMAEQERRATEGRFFFSFSHFVTSARKT